MNKELNKVKNEGLVSTRCDMKLLEKAMKKANKGLNKKMSRYTFLHNLVEEGCHRILA